MATEYKLSYTASEINQKLATVDETKNALESNYYTSTDIDTKLEEANTSLEANLNTKADLVDGKIPTEQLPDDIGGGLTEVDWETNVINKPFGEVGWSIEWDGTPTNEDIDVTDTLGVVIHKVSEAKSKEELVSSSVSILMENGETEEFIVNEGHFLDVSDNAFVVMHNDLVVVITTKDAATENFYGVDVSFSSGGTWFCTSPVQYTTTSLISSDFNIKQLDKKFIPSEIGTWENMPDKPFGQTGWSIEWDGNTEGLDYVDLSDSLGVMLYNVAEPKTRQELIGVTVKYFYHDNPEEIIEFVISEDHILNTTNDKIFLISDGNELQMGIALEGGSTTLPMFDGFPLELQNAGIWLVVPFNYTVSYVGNTEIKQIDKKFIPDDIVASVSLTFDETPTEGSQNPVKSMGIHSAISALEGKITSTFCYKGTVENYADLPSSDNTVGDVWNIANADEANGVNAGDNAAWNGTDWDILAGVIDLSDYYTKTEIDSIALNGTVNLANYYTKTEINNMIGDCDTIINSIDALIGGVHA